MIETFADDDSEELFCSGKSAAFPADIVARAIRKLDMIDSAETVLDLRVPPGNRLHQHTGDRAGQHSISINDQWRICFRFESGSAYDVEICDYH